MAKPPSDEQLLAAFVRGDDAMFAELVRRYEQPLHAFICRLMGEPGEAPDLFQETFVRAFRAAASFRGQSSFKTWLYAIAANVCRSRLRRARNPGQASDGQVAALRDGSAEPTGAAEAEELGCRIAQAVAGLPLEQREVFVLKAYDELTYPEIARTLGRPLGTVKSQMRLALGRLRGDLRALAEAYGVS